MLQNSGNSLNDRKFTCVVQKLIFSKHLNASQTLFGGQLLSWIDEASALFAIEAMRTRRVLTKKLSEVIFENPGILGDIIQFWCRVTKEGRTSMTMELVVRTQNVDTLDQRDICRCELVYVAVDSIGKPTPWRRNS
jgi:acyl-CoA thioesterase YciA